MAVEYYSDLASTPPGFRTGTPSCGTLVLWTRVPDEQQQVGQGAASGQGADAARRAAERGLPAPFAPLGPTPRAVISSSGFAGMTFSDTIGFVPPDTHAATGPNHIIETVNTTFKIFDRSGNTVLVPTELNDFFNVPGHDLTDPVVFYDESLQRFFIGVVDFGTNDPPTSSNLLYAVSDNSSPTGTSSFSNKYSIPVHRKAKFGCSGTVEADFTRAGWNADAHVFAFNMFNFGTNCFDGVRIVVIDKSSIGGTLAFKLIDLSNSHFTVVPAVMHGTNCGDPMWFVEAAFGQANQVRVLKMINLLTSPSISSTTNIDVTGYNVPPSASQPGGVQTIDTGDSRILNVEWRNNRLVATHAVLAFSVARARWYEFDTSGPTPTKTQEGNINNQGAGVHTYFPSIAIAANGDLGMTFMQSSSSEFMSMYVTGQLSGGTGGAMESPVLAKAGQAHYIAFDCDQVTDDHFPVCRAGDYSGISADPAVPNMFCAANEYATNAVGAANWGTWMQCFSLAAPDAPVVPGAPLVCEPPRTHDLAVTAIKAPKSVAGGLVGNVFGAVSVTIQNRSDHTETVTLASLADGVTTGLVRLDVQPGSGGGNENCNPATWQLDPVKTPALFSKSPTKILKIGGTMAVTFRVTYNCSNPLGKGLDPDIADYTHTATVHHEALAGAHADEHVEDDVCPRSPQGFDLNPVPKGTTDKGCGAKTPSGVLGGDVVTNILP